ncbi:hypothetical protein [Undibacter mobilis]|uniref:Uncharacterized protein n=1 Tax=Undibacter mobilis TaxID=2292256 RepID=A0A371B4B0_9BRAD|nr:hypothetical protein [Undibacter mobilis]RDV02273.1 hypothetical protein DXH78_16930 [Undibacter mobilis]
MGRPRIIITCPETGIAVISRIAYEDMINPLKAPMDFKCPCGETHRLKFAGLQRRREPATRPTPQAL